VEVEGVAGRAVGEFVMNTAPEDEEPAPEHPQQPPQPLSKRKPQQSQQPLQPLSKPQPLPVAAGDSDCRGESSGDSGPLPLGSAGYVTVYGLSSRPDLNNRVGRILSYNEDKGRYAVRMPMVRERVLVHPRNLHQSSDDIRRTALQMEFDKLPSPILQQHLDVFCCSDCVNDALLQYESHEGNVNLLPGAVAQRIHIQLLRAYFVGQAKPQNNVESSSLLLSFAPFWVREGNRMRHCSTKEATDAIMAQVQLACDAAGPGGDKGPGCDVSVLLRGFAFAMHRLGAADAMAVIPVNVTWVIISVLTDTTPNQDGGFIPSIMQPAIDKYLRDNGASDLCWRDLVWCLCVIHNALKKDIRVVCPEILEIRSHEATLQAVQLMEIAVKLVPGLPHGHWNLMTLMIDTHELLPLAHQLPQLDKAYRIFERGQAIARVRSSATHSSTTAFAQWRRTGCCRAPTSHDNTCILSQWCARICAVLITTSRCASCTCGRSTSTSRNSTG
jgi:hypothetical protein